ncbi:hypothetical protein [Anabaena sp. PCC 7108]|uniref:hypothetical protein n=1 Tax=Anabaena sp. PCC 7108 TaxID=163908 RepID=UPI000345FE3A|nr:hypothetical protein [Anabaena sp. PCC 7108]
MSQIQELHKQAMDLAANLVGEPTRSILLGSVIFLLSNALISLQSLLARWFAVFLLPISDSNLFLRHVSYFMILRVPRGLYFFLLPLLIEPIPF